MRFLAPAVAATALTALLFSAARSAADDLSSTPAAPTARADAELTGEEIYQRVLDNTYDSFIKDSSLTSGDHGGNQQWSRFKMWFQSEKLPDEELESGTVTSKSLVRYSEPYDIRHSAYLVLARNEEVNDQFVYMPSQRRVKRVNLRGEAVFGSDFSFEDILPRSLEDATYKRLPDERTLERDCFVVEATPSENATSEYSKMLVHVEKERSVPLLTRYWDERGVEIKELKADTETIEMIEGIWVAKRMTMRHLKLESYTTLEIASIQANAKMSPRTFELRRLESH